jgi:hypothetical protein
MIRSTLPLLALTVTLLAQTVSVENKGLRLELQQADGSPRLLGLKSC